MTDTSTSTAPLVARFTRLALACGAAIALAFTLPANAAAQPTRLLRPDDMFAIEETGRTAWSPDGGMVAVEFRKSDRWLDWNIPTSDLRVLDIATAQWRTIAARRGAYVGFFGAAWSPNGNTLLFLSLDSNAVARPWLWTKGAAAPRMLDGLQILDGLLDAPRGLWIDDTHVAFLVRDSTTANSGALHAQLLAHRNIADRWRVAHEDKVASVAVMRSGAPDTVVAKRRLVSVDIRNGTATLLASGEVNNPELSRDRRTITYRQHRAPLGAFVDTALFGADTADADYLRANWGDVYRTIDARTGAEIPAGSIAAPAPQGPPTTRPPAAPRADARLKSASPDRNVALYVTATDTGGSHLWLVRRDAAPRTVWHGNAWVREVKAGKSERIVYADATGRSLNGWVLYPPDHRAGERLPVVTIVYPGSLFTEERPTDFDLLDRSYEAPQLFAALGYAVVLPSIPYPDRPMYSDMIAPLTAGVLPLLDTLVARGIADGDRIAVIGQSAGGYSVQALITQTDRFRTAISTAGYSNLISLYGTFYGQYRHGDAGDPQYSTILRMMQSERGYYGAGAPPWELLDRYIANSPIFKVANVKTPLLLVQGENDFISVQQSEEYFTALYRQNKRVEFRRYYGEDHTVTRRANVLDFWQRLESWLQETMPRR
jgi:dipeptidyl aminopeptidase/acylaminoacyl peptidase